jgi:hypothetical protein
MSLASPGRSAYDPSFVVRHLSSDPADFADVMVNGELRAVESPAFKPPFTKRKLGNMDGRPGRTTFVNSLLVLGAANITAGVNHSGVSPMITPAPWGAGRRSDVRES